MGSNPTLSVGVMLDGEVLEWPNRRDWKSRVPSKGEPWVRIPPSPPVLYGAFDINMRRCCMGKSGCV